MIRDRISYCGLKSNRISVEPPKECNCNLLFVNKVLLLRYDTATYIQFAIELTICPRLEVLSRFWRRKYAWELLSNERTKNQPSIKCPLS